MKRISEITAQIKSHYPSHSNLYSAAPDDRSYAIIDRLFAKFALIYRKRWTAQFTYKDDNGNDQLDETELQLLREEWATSVIPKLPLERVKTAIDVIKNKNQWPPTIAEFIDACGRDTELDADIEYMKAATQSLADLHPVTIATARDVGQYEIRTKAEKTMKPSFKRAFKVNLAKFESGEEINSAIIKEPEHLLTYTPAEVAKEQDAINKLKQTENLTTAEAAIKLMRESLSWKRR